MFENWKVIKEVIYGYQAKIVKVLLFFQSTIQLLCLKTLSKIKLRSGNDLFLWDLPEKVSWKLPAKFAWELPAKVSLGTFHLFR